MAKVKDYLRLNKLPHIWCAGCGDGMIAGALIRAIDKSGLDRDNIAVITGIGCSARFNNIMDFDTFQTTHGRALSFATGFKMAKPGMKVIVVTGDGDSSGIGGNHLIHTARRNIDMTVIVINNNIYGMTGGQYSPLTPYGAYASTAKYQTFEYPFDISKLVEAAGATYVARGTAYHINLTEKLIYNALNHKGFSLVEVITQCPTNFGRRNKIPKPYDLLMWQKENSVNVEDEGKFSSDELKNKFLIGELCKRDDRVEFTESYKRVIERASNSKGGGKK